MADYGGAVAVGMVVGITFTFSLVYFMRNIEATKFKRTLSECDDTKRKEVKDELDGILGHYKKIVEKTNTLIFKRKTNTIIDFISYLEKYRIN